MNLKRRLIRDVQPTVLRAAPEGAGLLAAPPNGGAGGVIDWSGWLRQIERKRRLLGRLLPAGHVTRREFPPPFLSRLTAASFCLDGMEVTDAMVDQAVHPTPRRRPFRSRLAQRLRNHLAILYSIQRLLSSCRALKVSTVVRWYTSVSCGLCNAALDAATMSRLEIVVGWISSPRLRLQPAVADVARLHAQLMYDPLAPSFNGILARLLLCYHLGRCGLPPVLFDPVGDREILGQEGKLLPRLMELIDVSYSVILLGKFPGAAEL